MFWEAASTKTLYLQYRCGLVHVSSENDPRDKAATFQAPRRRAAKAVWEAGLTECKNASLCHPTNQFAANREQLTKAKSPWPVNETRRSPP